MNSVTALSPAPLSTTFVVPRYWPNMGGAEQHSRALVQELAKRHKPRVIRFCSTEHGPTDYAYPFNRSETVLDGAVPVSQPGPRGMMRSALKLLATHAPQSRLSRAGYQKLSELVLPDQLKSYAQGSQIVHTIYNGFTPSSAAAARLDVPFVWTPLAHTTKAAGKAWSSRGFRRLYARADAVIAMTEYERDWLIGQGAKKDRVHVCPMAPLLSVHKGDGADFRARHNLGHAPIILFLGRLVDYKGYKALLGAAGDIWRCHPNARLVLAGPADEQVRRELASRTDPRIKYVGVITEQEKNDALDASTMICVPSTEESLGVVYLEAWMFSKPVIAADIPVMKSVISDGEDGLLVQQTPADITKAVNTLLSDPLMAYELGRAGHKKVLKHYTWERAAEQHEAIYKALI